MSRGSLSLTLNSGLAIFALCAGLLLKSDEGAGETGGRKFECETFAGERRAV